MKADFYESLGRQASALLAGEDDLIAGMANFSAFLNDNLDDLNWAGFYIKRGEELILGPFQGKVACTRIPLGKGVCGTAAELNKTLRVADVHLFDGHIACDSASNAEIVIPVRQGNKVIAVLDIDSPLINRFDEEDQKGLELLVKCFESCLLA